MKEKKKKTSSENGKKSEYRHITKKVVSSVYINDTFGTPHEDICHTGTAINIADDITIFENNHLKNKVRVITSNNTFAHNEKMHWKYNQAHDCFSVSIFYILYNIVSIILYYIVMLKLW